MDLVQIGSLHEIALSNERIDESSPFPEEAIAPEV